MTMRTSFRRAAILLAAAACFSRPGARDAAGGRRARHPQAPGRRRGTAPRRPRALRRRGPAAPIWIDPPVHRAADHQRQPRPGPNEKQVIAVKRLADVGSPVRLIVVDADPSRGTYYFPSWETDTSATDTRVFSLSARDIIGDHSLQIVANGMDEAGRLYAGR